MTGNGIETSEISKVAFLEARVHELEQEVADLRVQIDTDAKTGLFSHRFFEDYILPEIQLYIQFSGTAEQREGSPKLVFGVGDINAMNLINGLIGHPGGDEVLKKTAQVLSNSVRDTDWVGRSGEAGDEFYFLLRIQPDVSVDAAISSFETRIQEGLKTIIDPGFPVSMALGLVDVSQYDNIGDIRISADQIMYERKRVWKLAQKAAGLMVSDRVEMSQT